MAGYGSLTNGSSPSSSSGSNSSSSSGSSSSSNSGSSSSSNSKYETNCPHGRNKDGSCTQKSNEANSSHDNSLSMSSSYGANDTKSTKTTQSTPTSVRPTRTTQSPSPIPKNNINDTLDKYKNAAPVKKKVETQTPISNTEESKSTVNQNEFTDKNKMQEKINQAQNKVDTYKNRKDNEDDYDKIVNKKVLENDNIGPTKSNANIKPYPVDPTQAEKNRIAALGDDRSTLGKESDKKLVATERAATIEKKRIEAERLKKSLENMDDPTHANYLTKDKQAERTKKADEALIELAKARAGAKLSEVAKGNRLIDSSKYKLNNNTYGDASARTANTDTRQKHDNERDKNELYDPLGGVVYDNQGRTPVKGSEVYRRKPESRREYKTNRYETKNSDYVIREPGGKLPGSEYELVPTAWGGVSPEEQTKYRALDQDKVDNYIRHRNNYYTPDNVSAKYKDGTRFIQSDGTLSAPINNANEQELMQASVQSGRSPAELRALAPGTNIYGTSVATGKPFNTNNGLNNEPQTRKFQDGEYLTAPGRASNGAGDQALYDQALFNNKSSAIQQANNYVAQGRSPQEAADLVNRDMPNDNMRYMNPVAGYNANDYRRNWNVSPSEAANQHNYPMDNVDPNGTLFPSYLSNGNPEISQRQIMDSIVPREADPGFANITQQSMLNKLSNGHITSRDRENQIRNRQLDARLQSDPEFNAAMDKRRAEFNINRIRSPRADHIQQQKYDLHNKSQALAHRPIEPVNSSTNQYEEYLRNNWNMTQPVYPGQDQMIKPYGYNMNNGYGLNTEDDINAQYRFANRNNQNYANYADSYDDPYFNY